MDGFDRIVVVGCNGGFGDAFGRQLARDGAHLTGIDVGATAASSGLWHDYVSQELGAGTRGDAARAIEAADLTLLCVPETVVLAALPQVLGAARPGACVADIASVKSRIAAAVDRLPTPAGYLSLHPMFAPTAGFTHRNVVVVPLRETPATERLEKLLARWSVRLSRMNAEAHDRAAAYVQAMPHSVLLAIGLTLTESGPGREALDDVATPVHDAMLSLLARIVATRNDTYRSIQADNPFAAEARAALASALARVDEISANRDAAAYDALTECLSDYLGVDLDTLLRRAEDIVAAGSETRDKR